MSEAREQLRELGRRGPYYRYVNFPVETKEEIDVFIPTQKISLDPAGQTNCMCNIQTLMATGCRCGWIERERSGEA
jgi:hypothetical protein